MEKFSKGNTEDKISDSPAVETTDLDLRTLKDSELLPIEQAKEIISRYGIKIIFPSDVKRGERVAKSFLWMDEHAKPPVIPDKEKENCIRGIASEMIMYPEEFFRSNGINKFYIISSEIQGGFVDTISKRLYLSIENYRSIPLKVREGFTFHHELLHLLEIATPQGREFKKTWNLEFPRISTLKQIIFKILGKAVGDEFDKRKEKFWEIPSSEWKKKYLSNYSALNEKEDRAMTAGLLFVSPEYMMNTLAKNTSEIIKRKLSYAISLYYKLSPKMDAGFWADYAMGKVDANYWRTRRY